MNQFIETARQQFQRLSPVMKFGVVMLAFIALFLVWDSTIRQVGLSWELAVSEMQEEIDRLESGRQLEKKASSVGATIITLGEVAVPPNESEAREALTRTIDKILDEFRSRITGEDFSQGQVTLLPANTLQQVIESDERAAQVTFNFQFEAPPEVASEIITRLEASPNVTSIRSVHITRIGGSRSQKQVKVNLELQTWIITQRRSRDV